MRQAGPWGSEGPIVWRRGVLSGEGPVPAAMGVLAPVGTATSGEARGLALEDGQRTSAPEIAIAVAAWGREDTINLNGRRSLAVPVDSNWPLRALRILPGLPEN